MTRPDPSPAEALAGSGAPPAAEAGATDRDQRLPRRHRGSGRITRRQLFVGCAAIAYGLHTLAVLYTWIAWRAEPGARSWWVVFTDMPVSLLYGHFTNELLLLWSLTLGGLQWAFTGALVAWLVWRFTAAPGRPRS